MRYKVYANIRDGSQDLCKFSLDFMPASLYYVYRKRHAVVVFKFKCLFMTAVNTAAAGAEVRDCSGDVGSGVAKCDPQSIWNPRKTVDLS